MEAITYPFTALVTLLTLLVYFWMTMQVGKARGKHEIQAPATDGPEEFLRVFRTHANTVEAIIMFFPSLWIFALLYSDAYAALIGIFFVLGRIIYARGYYQEAQKRATGFLIGFLSTIILLLGALGGVIYQIATSLAAMGQ